MMAAEAIASKTCDGELTDRWPALSANFPRHATTAYRYGDLLPQPLFDHRPPRHQAETHAVIEHGVASAGQLDGAPVDARHALPVGHRAMLQAGFGRNVLGGLRQFPIAQRAQQVPG